MKHKTSFNPLLVGIAVVLIIIGVFTLEAHFNSGTRIVEMAGLYSINQVVKVNNSTVAFAGVGVNGNTSVGMAGLLFLNNLSYIYFNVSKYFLNGSIYSIAYNGSAFLMGGAKYIKSGNSTFLEPEVVLLTSEGVKNFTSQIPRFYTPGQVLAVSWDQGFWLIGGSSLEVEGTSTFQIPFLLKLTSNISDLTTSLPRSFYSPLSVGTGIFTISSGQDKSFIAGAHLFNFTFAVYNGTGFNSQFQNEGAIITSSYSPLGWLFGGFNYSSRDDGLVLTLFGTYNDSGIHFIKLKYEVGIVNSVGYGEGKYLVALRIPVVNNLTMSTSEEGIILAGNSLSTLTQVFNKVNVSINSIVTVHEHIVGGGYSIVNGERHAIIVLINLK
ncbi:MAG: hypothetical protein QXR57_05940 [Metallosphaera sp.]|uniref:hypothetical protein n=1 Tax=Metallosphaera sp. TaxID=2020860 RepID=UPI0031675BE5